MNTYPFANYSEEVLRKIELFFKHYKPIPQDREWAEKRKEEIAAEIRRREREDEEAFR